MNSRVKTGIELIAEERAEQIHKHGFTSENDQQYKEKPGSLGLAAIAYTTMATSSTKMRDALRAAMPRTDVWPAGWNPTFWRPGKGNTFDDRISELRKAGALIAAEIDFQLWLKDQQP